MAYEITKRQIDETPFLHMRKEVEPQAISEALGSMFPPVFEFATTRGIAFAGPPTARYPSRGTDHITIEAGMPIAGSGEGEGEVQLGSLFGGTVATTVHKGPYETLGEAHRAIEKWLAENGEQAGGPPWEVYLTDPGEVEDPNEWLTEINWPLR